MFIGLVIIIFFMLIALIWAQWEIDRLKNKLDLREGKESIEEECSSSWYQYFVSYTYSIDNGVTTGYGSYICNSSNKIASWDDIEGLKREAGKNFNGRNSGDIPDIVILNYILTKEKGKN